MDLIFCGTAQFAVPTLQELVRAGHTIQLVVTQPDKPVGRGQQMTAPPVKTAALELGLPIAQPEKIKNDTEFKAQLDALRPRAIVVVAYGKLIPKWMLELPPLGNINLHGSLLPKYRGAAPIQWAIANGEAETGATTMQLDEGLDTGAMLLSARLPISESDTAVTIAPRLAVVGADLMLHTLRGLESGTLSPTPQDNAQASLAPILTKDDGRIDFSRTAREIFNRLRGFQPWPGAFTTFRGKKLVITAAHPAEAGANPAPGKLRLHHTRIYVGCGQDSALELLEVQPEGKKRMAARDFLNGYQPEDGETLG